MFSTYLIVATVAVYSILSVDGLPIKSANKFHNTRQARGVGLVGKVRGTPSTDVNNMSKDKKSTLNSNSEALLHELSAMDSRFGDMDDEQEYQNYNDEIGGIGSKRPHDQINQEHDGNAEQNFYEDYEYDMVDAESNEDELLRKYYGLPLKRAAFEDYEFSDDIMQLMRAETLKREAPFLKQLTNDDSTFGSVLENDDAAQIDSVEYDDDEYVD